MDPYRPHEKRKRAAHALRASDKVANSFRLFTRSGGRLLKSLRPLSITSALYWIMLFSILTNIVDSAAKSYLEITTNPETGLLYLFKVSIPLGRLGLALVALTMIPYTPVFNTIDMLFGAVNKLGDAVVAKKRGNADFTDKLHDFIVAAATFTGAALMLTVAPGFGEALLLASTYYYIMDAFGANPLRSTTTPEKKITPPLRTPPITDEHIQDQASDLTPASLPTKRINRYKYKDAQKFGVFANDANKSESEHTTKQHAAQRTKLRRFGSSPL